MSEPAPDSRIDAIIADAAHAADLPLADQPDAFERLHDQLAGELDFQQDTGRTGS